MAHTPGPWIIHEFKLSGHCRIFPSDGPRVGSIADVYASKANAQLIAAAPDLLAALKMAISLDDAIDAFAGNEDIRSAVRAAIAKAEGR